MLSLLIFASIGTPRLHLVTAARRVGALHAYDGLTTSAHASAFDVVYLGMGAPPGTTYRLRAVRDFAWSLESADDLVLYADAEGAMVVSGPSAITRTFLALEAKYPAKLRSAVLFAAARSRAPGALPCDERCATTTQNAYLSEAETRVPHLESGGFIGRASAVRRLLGALGDETHLPLVVRGGNRRWLEAQLATGAVAIDTERALFLGGGWARCAAGVEGSSGRVGCGGSGIDWTSVGAELVGSASLEADPTLEELRFGGRDADGLSDEVLRARQQTAQRVVLSGKGRLPPGVLIVPEHENGAPDARGVDTRWLLLEALYPRAAAAIEAQASDVCLTFADKHTCIVSRKLAVHEARSAHAFRAFCTLALSFLLATLGCYAHAVFRCCVKCLRWRARVRARKKLTGYAAVAPAAPQAGGRGDAGGAE